MAIMHLQLSHLRPTKRENLKPAFIHLRFSCKNHHYLITQLCFKGDRFIENDAYGASLQSVNRILEIKK